MGIVLFEFDTVFEQWNTPAFGFRLPYSSFSKRFLCDFDPQCLFISFFRRTFATSQTCQVNVLYAGARFFFFMQGVPLKECHITIQIWKYCMIRTQQFISPFVNIWFYFFSCHQSLKYIVYIRIWFFEFLAIIPRRLQRSFHIFNCFFFVLVSILSSGKNFPRCGGHRPQHPTIRQFRIGQAEPRPCGHPDLGPLTTVCARKSLVPRHTSPIAFLLFQFLVIFFRCSRCLLVLGSLSPYCCVSLYV